MHLWSRAHRHHWPGATKHYWHSSCETCAFSEAQLCSSDAEPAGLRLLWDQHQISAQVVEQQLWVAHVFTYLTGSTLILQTAVCEMHMPPCDVCAQIWYRRSLMHLHCSLCWSMFRQSWCRCHTMNDSFYCRIRSIKSNLYWAHLSIIVSAQYYRGIVSVKNVTCCFGDCVCLVLWPKQLNSHLL